MIRAATVAALVAGFLASAPAADALSCAAPEGPYSDAADVVFDGVLLSGPHEEPLGRLASPARIHVFRYLKGSGPRVVEIGTNVPLVTPGDDPGVFGEIPGVFAPYPGQVYRVYGDVRERTGSSARSGVYTPDPCGGTYERRTGTYLRGVRGSRVAERDAGGRRWAAELLRGPGGVACVRVHPGLDHDSIECNRFEYPHRVVKAVVPAGGDTWATALAVAHPRLESITVDGPFGKIERRAGRAGVALAVLPGYFEQVDLAAFARFENGTTRELLGYGRGRLVPDPQRPDLVWTFSTRHAYPPTPTICVAFAQRPDTSRSGRAFGAPRHGECGSSDHGFFAVRYVDRFDADERRSRHATFVFGVRGVGVQGVRVTGPDGERTLAFSRGGVFATAYPPDVDYEELTVTIHHSDYGAETFRGRRDDGVLSPPHTELDTGY